MTTALLTDTVSERLASAVDFALLWGHDSLALRTVSGERVPHINESAVGARLEESEFEIALIDPGVFEVPSASRAVWMNEVALFDEIATFCRRMNVGTVRVGALGGGPGSGDALRALGEAAGRHDLRVAVGNAPDTEAATGAALAKLLAEVAHPAVGADWRPAAASGAGEHAPDGLKALLAADVSVWSVEARDVADGKDVVPGEGTLGWPEMLAALAAAGFDGPLVLDLSAWRSRGERIGSVGLRASTALIHLARAASR